MAKAHVDVVQMPPPEPVTPGSLYKQGTVKLYAFGPVLISVLKAIFKWKLFRAVSHPSLFLQSTAQWEPNPEQGPCVPGQY